MGQINNINTLTKFWSLSEWQLPEMKRIYRRYKLIRKKYKYLTQIQKREILEALKNNDMVTAKLILTSNHAKK